VEEWVQLAAAILARMLRNVAVITPPQLVEPRLKMVELISLRELLALLLLLFDDASFRQRKVSLDAAISQEDLNAISRRLTDVYRGLTVAEIRDKGDVLSPTEGLVAKALLEVMDEAGGEGVGEPHFDGLSHILSQPEFTKGESALVLIELLEKRNLLSSILSQAPGDERLRVIIGEEANTQPALQGFSVVLSRYGLPKRASGVIGVLGPTRMPYERVFPAVRFLSDTMTDLLHEAYG
jgi:heat-inducible transcriptional repressor